MFEKVDACTWKGETEHYTLAITKNGHVGYWIVFTNKVTGNRSERYGKHFKALNYWVEKFEGWATEDKVAA